MERILSPNERLKAQDLIAEAQDAISSKEWDQASNKLTQAITHIYITVSEQQKRQAQEKTEAKARLTVLSISISLLLIVIVLSYGLRNVWAPDMTVPVISLPISIIVWSFIGGVAAMLQAFVGTKRDRMTTSVNYEWLLWRPIVGTVMGSVIYLVISAGLATLGQGSSESLADAKSPYFFWALSFLGGFSDRFTILVFDNIVRPFSKSNGEEKPSENSERT